jgi:hypothetical protein
VLIEEVVPLAFEVGGDEGGGFDGLFKGLLDGRGHGVGVTQEDLVGKAEVQFDQMGVADVAVAEVVVGDAVAAGLLGDDAFDEFVHVGIGGIHESADAAADEAGAGEQDVEGGSHGEHGVPVGPAGGLDQPEGEENAEAGPAIGGRWLRG